MTQSAHKGLDSFIFVVLTDLFLIEQESRQQVNTTIVVDLSVMRRCRFAQVEAVLRSKRKPGRSSSGCAHSSLI